MAFSSLTLLLYIYSTLKAESALLYLSTKWRRRFDSTFSEKHERGLHLLPVVFDKNHREITFFFDAPCAQIREISNLISESTYILTLLKYYLRVL